MCQNASGIMHSKNNFGTIRKSCSGKKESGSEPACTFSFIPMKLLFHAYETSVPCRREFQFHAYETENSCRQDFADININRTFAPLLTPVRVMGN